MHSCISCSLVASRMTKMFSLRADSCCCCLSFSSDSFRPVTSLAKTWKRGRESKRVKRESHSPRNGQIRRCGGITRHQRHWWKSKCLLTTQLSIFRLQDLDICFMLFPSKTRKKVQKIYVPLLLSGAFPQFNSQQEAGQLSTLCTTPLWSGSSCQIHWGEPVWGKYTSRD